MEILNPILPTPDLSKYSLEELEEIIKRPPSTPDEYMLQIKYESSLIPDIITAEVPEELRKQYIQVSHNLFNSTMLIMI